MTQETKPVTIDARHTFTDSEMSQLGVHASRVHREHERTEEEFKSSKKDWQAKLDRIALERDGVLRKLGDGFEMRPVQAVVRFDDPSPGRKTFYFADKASLEYGLVPIREEAMDSTDFQRDLPLDTYGLTGNVHDEQGDGVPISMACRQCAEAGDPVNPGRFPETGDNAAEVREAREVIEGAAQPIGTPFAVKLAEAAGGKTLERVVIDYPEGFTGDKYRALWRKAAKKQGWPEAAIDLLDGVASDAQHLKASLAESSQDPADPAQRVLDVLGAHSISTAANDEQTHAPHSEQPDTQ